jgi:hypothetical protein
MIVTNYCAFWDVFFCKASFASVGKEAGGYTDVVISGLILRQDVRKSGTFVGLLWWSGFSEVSWGWSRPLGACKDSWERSG